MSSTVTISTITTISTMIGFGVTLGSVAVIALAIFLCTKQLTAVSAARPQQFLAKALDVSIAPLIIVFVMILAMKVVEILA